MGTFLPGISHPLGATINPGGVNFSIFSKHATQVELLLFEHVDAGKPSHIFQLNPAKNRTGYYWHLFVPGIRAGQLYGWRMQGPQAPERGLFYDGDKVLLDPYGRSVAVGSKYSRADACRPGENFATSMKSEVVDPRAYDWQGDRPLKRPLSSNIIYELHVAGFTSHPNSGVAPEKRGTYAGLIEKIPYLQSLGVTAVELLPVYQFDAQDAPPRYKNYWGYSPISFFAPHAAYSSCKDALGPVDEFRDMVKALHRAQIEVILDVVYNHTTEGNANGPMLSFRGLENRAYYILADNRSRFADFTGCGNTLNVNQSIVRRMILDSLHYWVQLMHVDGFRFDLASIFARDEFGNPQESSPLLWEIESDPVLAGTKLIAEAWDAAGLYQVGSFMGDFFMEWNGRFRDDVRSFWKGDPGTVQRIADRFIGSPDLYSHEEREPEQSINFITCHDGFTLNDLVSYNEKHNEANGEDNRDGNPYNISWNCGVEGPTDDPGVEALRNRQVKNFLATTLLSLGTPMIMMGDEVRRTQLGNNNAYVQDNETAWFDWNLLEKHADLLRFTQKLIALRPELPFSQMAAGALTLNQVLQSGPVTWHGTHPGQPDWGEASHSLAFTVSSPWNKRQFYIALNGYWEALEFNLPRPAGGPRLTWRRVMDTGLASPDDINLLKVSPLVPGRVYLAQARSLVVLMAAAPKKTPAPYRRR